MAKHYFDPDVSKEVTNYAITLLKKHSDVLYDAKLAKIAYLASFPKEEKEEQKAKFTARIKKANDEVAILTGYNYIITVDGLWWNNTSSVDKEKEILHNLMHIQQHIDKKGNENWKIKKHDVEDFTYVLDIKN